MAKYSAIAAQDIAPNASAIFTTTVIPPATPGLIFHSDGTGVFRLASPAKIMGREFTGCKCNRRLLFADYDVSIDGNIAVATGGTAGEISMAIAVDGVIDLSTVMQVTPAAAGEFNHISVDTIVRVPAICGCETISLVSTSDQTITLQNASITIPGAQIKL